MMHFKTNVSLKTAMATWIAIGCVATGPASAVTLTNNDQIAYQVEVTAESARRSIELDAGKSMADFCKKGCVIRLNGIPENEYSLEGSERVSIEGGLLYYDGEEVPPKTGTPDAAAK